MLTADEESCRDRLERWTARFDELMDMFDGRTGRLPREQLALARERYTSLKHDLESEYKAGANSRRRPPLTAAERAWYQPTIHQAHVALRAKTNAAPETWFSGLYDAQGDIDAALSSLNAKRSE